MSEIDFSRKHAVIIGATSGMGLEVARILHRDGWILGLAGRREDLLQNVATEMGSNVFIQRIDVCSDDAEQHLLELIQKMDGIELLFHAAGIGKQNPTLQADTELRTAQTNVLGFIRTVTAAFRYFEAHGGGHIAVISSIAGTKGLGAAPAYSATKRFQNTYLQCLAQQAHIRHLPISFTDIRPGFVDTALLSDGHKYPMLLSPVKVAERIVKAIYARRRKVVIDWRYAILTFFWRLIPDYIWERLNISTKE